MQSWNGMAGLAAVRMANAAEEENRLSAAAYISSVSLNAMLVLYVAQHCLVHAMWLSGLSLFSVYCLLSNGCVASQCQWNLSASVPMKKKKKISFESWLYDGWESLLKERNVTVAWKRINEELRLAVSAEMAIEVMSK
jgi:hypothetical protein